MKKIIKGKWIFGAIVVVMVFFLLVFLYCKGFRITYAPALENSWDAISAFAAWAGVALSFATMMVAIQIPKIIADRQDKIALFEKRMECFTTLQNIFAFARQISDAKQIIDIQAAIKIYFGEAALFTEKQNYTWYIITLKRQEPKIVEGLFLFPKYNEKIIQDVLINIIELSVLVAVETKEEAQQPISDIVQACKEKICNVCSNLETTLVPLMEKELQLYMR